MNAKRDQWDGVRIGQFAPAGAKPILQLTLQLSADGRVCDFHFNPLSGHEFEAGVLAFQIGSVHAKDIRHAGSTETRAGDKLRTADAQRLSAPAKRKADRKRHPD